MGLAVFSWKSLQFRLWTVGGIGTFRKEKVSAVYSQRGGKRGEGGSCPLPGAMSHSLLRLPPFKGFKSPLTCAWSLPACEYLLLLPQVSFLFLVLCIYIYIYISTVGDL